MIPRYCLREGNIASKNGQPDERGFCLLKGIAEGTYYRETCVGGLGKRTADRCGVVLTGVTGRATAGGWCAAPQPGTLRNHWPRAWPVSGAQRRGVL